MRETWVRSLGWEDPLEKGKATHSSILAWIIPWMGSQRVGHDWATFIYMVKLDLVDLIKLKLFRQLDERINWIIWVGSKCNHKGQWDFIHFMKMKQKTWHREKVLRRKQREVESEKMLHHQIWKWRKRSKVKGCSPTSWERPENTLFSRPSRGSVALRGSWFWLSEIFCIPGFRNCKKGICFIICSKRGESHV